MEFTILLLLFIVGVFVGLYSALIGGGVLITIPLMIFLGLSPQAAIGTSKLDSLGSNISSGYNFYRQKKIDYKIGLISSISLVIGTILGTIFVISLDEILVKKIIAIFTICMLIILIINNHAGITQIKKVITWKSWLISSILFFLIGIYAGFFGGGFGTLLSYVFIFIFGKTFIETAATRKLPGICSNIISLLIFYYFGLVNFLFGITLFFGRFIGGYISSYYADKIGNKWIKRGFIFIVLFMTLRLLIN